MRLILVSSEIINWKALNIVIKYDPDVTIISAENKKGKSRIKDANRWNLTGKDTEDRLNYDIKNTDDTSMNRLGHIVKNTYLKDGKELILYRNYIEQWVTPTGQSEPEMKGHTTLYERNNDKMPAGLYDEFVKEIADMKTLKMLTDPLYFNNLEPDERRAILIEMAGAVEQSDILEKTKLSKERLQIITNLLNAKDDLKVRIGSNKAKIKLNKDSLKAYPKTIEEAGRKIPTETEADFLKAEADIATLKAREAAIITEMTSISNEAETEMLEFFAKQNAITAKKNDFNSVYSRIKQAHKDKIENGSANLVSLEKKLESTQRELKSTESLLKAKETELKSVEDTIKADGVAYLALKESKFVFDEQAEMKKTVCEYCGNSIKHINLEEIKAHKEGEFNKKRADSMTALKEKGQRVNESLTPLKELIASYRLTVAEQATLITELTEKINTEKTSVPKMPEAEEMKAEAEADAEGKAIMEEIATLTAALGEKPEKKESEELKTQREEVEKLVDEKKAFLLKRQAKVDALARIEELKAEEKALAQKTADLENENFAIEQYTNSFHGLVAEKVNSMFTTVQFVLFEKLVGSDETKNVCQAWALKDGKPYVKWGSMSNGEKNIVGLECIKVLNKFYDKYLPIFIDNAESITSKIKMDTQLILLKAVENQPTLFVEFQ